MSNETLAYSQCLDEANQQIQTGRYCDAIDSISHGITMLMQTLYAELCNKLKTDDTAREQELRDIYSQFAKSRSGYKDLTFDEWITFYTTANIYDELYAAFHYDFKTFNSARFYRLKMLRNNCDHADYQATQAQAMEARNLFRTFLAETQRSEQKSAENYIESWHRKWDHLIQQWLQADMGSPEAPLVATLIDQFMLAVGLMREKRIPRELKQQLILAVGYVLDPDDHISEAAEGVRGLVDDAAVLTLTLYWLAYHKEIDENILREHWSNESDPIERLSRLHHILHETHSAYFSSEIWDEIAPIAKHGPQALESSWRGKKETIDSLYQFLTENTSEADWDKRWRSPIYAWVKNNASEQAADALLLLPDMFVLVTRLMHDPRIAAGLRAKLLAPIIYVISPFDLIPEALLGVVGLTDDMTALALTGYWIMNVIKIDKNILREHWPGKGDPSSVIIQLHQDVSENAEAIHGGAAKIGEILQDKFGPQEEKGALAKLRGIFDRSS